jgi:hypothetical protein
LPFSDEGVSRVAKDSPNAFTLLVASAQSQPSALHDIEGIQGVNAKLKVQYGDFAADLAKAVVALNEVFVLSPFVGVIPFIILHL